MLTRVLSLTVIALLGLAAPAAAQEAKVPYWASIRASEVNMRVGPAEEYQIAWVYRRPQLPLKVLRVKDGWRLVQDPDGVQGWMNQRFLTRQRAGYINGKGPAEMRQSGDSGAKLLWRIAPGNVGLLGDCDAGWCQFEMGKRKGFVEQSRLWGAGEP
jgi:SH3-like domain-containing protein